MSETTDQLIQWIAYRCEQSPKGQTDVLLPKAWLTPIVAACRSGQWQPIETARQDGTARLLLARSSHATYGRVTIGSWAVSRRYVAGGYWADDSRSGISRPTHWMPLPLQPERLEHT